MNRPYVICHMLQSIDGKIAGGFFREKQTLELAKIYSDISKDYNGDAIIYGTTTAQEMFSSSKTAPVLNQNPIKKIDYIYKNDKNKWIVVIDPQGQISFYQSVYQNTRLKDKNLIVILTENISSQYLETLKSLNISYLFTGKDEIDLRLALEKLYDLFSIKKLLLQGGRITNTYFIKEDLIDELSLVVSPVVSGEEKQPNIFKDCHEYIGQTFDLKQSDLLMKSGFYLKYVRK
ncbi:dihydrofolate reductase family protein [Faecalibacillus faecis]|uniref:dihydrofolate reductase family protein n=1 Tax=Faecalibacillus faecis TaxID=1982628 RepID=UPI003863B14B